MTSAKQILKDALAASGKDDLSDHLKTIAVLREKRWTWREIARFLSERGVAVDHTKVYRFAKANEDEINKISKKGVNMSKSNQTVVPTASEYIDALNSITINDTQKKMLAAHYKTHNRSITYTELANAAGFDSYVAANSQYGKLGRTLGEQLKFKFIKSENRDALFYSSSIGMGNPNIPDDGEEFELVMHHELSKALDKLNWFND